MPPRSIVTAHWLETNLHPGLSATVAAREIEVLDAQIGRLDPNVVLYGAGNLGRRTLTGLRSAGVEPRAFVDSDPAIHGKTVDDLRVLSPSDAVRDYRDAAVVMTVWSPSRVHVMDGIHHWLRDQGLSRIASFVPLYWRYATSFLPYHCLDLPHRLYDDGEAIRQAYELFDDDESKEQFRIQVSYLLSTMDMFDIPRAGGTTYFPNDLFELGEDEVFVDCGAFDGDSLASFLEATSGSFEAVVAFEPDPDAWIDLQSYVRAQSPAARNRIRLEQKALGATTGTVQFDGGGTPGSRISESGDLLVDRVALDDVLRHVAPTFIKMDIEGAEEAALLGAANAIRDHRPILAICVYHLQSDIHRIPNLIAGLTADYHLYLRRQGDAGDLVCFAVPSERLRRNGPMRRT
jgi:FkbM family methyltransferase